MFFSKKIKAAALCAVAALSFGLLAGCGSDNAAKGDKTYNVGIVQLVEHDALDAANKGFVDGLKERGFAAGQVMAEYIYIGGGVWSQIVYYSNSKK